MLSPIQAEYMRYAKRLDQRISDMAESYGENADDYNSTSRLAAQKIQEARELAQNESTSRLIGAYQRNLDITRRMLLDIKEVNV